MKKFQPPIKGAVKVRPGRKTIWLARPSSLSLALSVSALCLVTLGLVAVGVPVVPWVWYQVKPSVTRTMARMLQQPVVQPKQQTLVRVYDDWQPASDSALLKKNMVVISGIKVSTEVVEAPAEEYEKALQQGVWRVPSFGTPDNRKLPTILVAHRFGYVNWSNTYRRVHSFFNLPKMVIGDKIAVDWNQRRYMYEVYAGDEGTQISDYSADLILYTCQYLESDQRIFKYARLIKE